MHQGRPPMTEDIVGTPSHSAGNFQRPVPRAPAQNNVATPSSAAAKGGFSPASRPLSSVRDRIGVFEKTGGPQTQSTGTTPYRAAAVLAAQLGTALPEKQHNRVPSPVQSVSSQEQSPEPDFGMEPLEPKSVRS